MKKSPPDFSAIQEVISRHLQPHALFVYFLGSVGTERFGEESDIDIAFLPQGEIDASRIWEIKMGLEAELGWSVDLVSLRGIDPIFGRQVIETGRLLFAVDPGVHLEWKSGQLSRYPDFKRSREGIEKNLLKRKKYV